MSTAQALRHRLAATLTEDDWLHDNTWRAAIETEPRELFLGPALFQQTGLPESTAWTALRRDSVPTQEWLNLTYRNDSWVTQVDGVLAEEATGPVEGSPSSSSTLPGLVVQMIERAGTTPGDRVLEIGTGTGYSTALLSNVLGARNVTSVEIDPDAAERARNALDTAGHHPTLITNDGLLGAPDGAPYDRLIAACSVRFVPYPWLRQIKPGGTILVTLGGWSFGHGLVRLTVDANGEATGRFLPGYTSFMLARPHDHPPRGRLEFLPGEQRPSRIDPTLLDDWTGRFVGQLAAPSAERFGAGAEQILFDVATGSQARTRPAEHEGWIVEQRGPLKLWDAIEDAIEVWTAAGSPHLREFGLTITRVRQRVWLGTPDGPSWLLPV
ncbi:ATP-grasp peptide maturase system methyltransferase [Streptomyces sp. NBC_01016]|uniref:ATP-grasp peptide maturase system methyltransferase n=1 Tax=Streptomyces sp. NBC_01016 TaxID=2903720 RepID=UPI002254D9CB|nr:ATP-grasp peptide maturase system methyltransferase [Streptomyces sp. NBC_01016]MCX4834365.1 ATP-grasp peptide maturase system methyltransferase [Streptomyces sp. NBC_01016]